MKRLFKKNKISKTGILSILILSSIFFGGIYGTVMSATTAAGSSNANNLIGIDGASWRGIYTCIGASSAKANKFDNGLEICSVSNLMNQINFLLNLMFKIFVPIATVAIVYAGFKLAMASPSEKSAAKKIFTNVVLGFIFMAGAFAIIKLIVTYIADPSYLFLINK